MREGTKVTLPCENHHHFILSLFTQTKPHLQETTHLLEEIYFCPVTRPAWNSFRCCDFSELCLPVLKRRRLVILLISQPAYLDVCVCVCFSKSKATFSLPSQDRLTRCTMHCNDKAKDLFDSGAKEPAVRSLMDRCVGSCVDDHINLIPSMTRRLKENLDSIEQWGAGLSWRAWAHHAHTVHTAAQG